MPKPGQVGVTEKSCRNPLITPSDGEVVPKPGQVGVEELSRLRVPKPGQVGVEELSHLVQAVHPRNDIESDIRYTGWGGGFVG